MKRHPRVAKSASERLVMWRDATFWASPGFATRHHHELRRVWYYGWAMWGLLAASCAFGILAIEGAYGWAPLSLALSFAAAWVEERAEEKAADGP